MGAETTGNEPGTSAAIHPHPDTSTGRAAHARSQAARRKRLLTTLVRLACIYGPFVLVNLADSGPEGLPASLLLMFVVPGYAISFGLPGPRTDSWIVALFISALFLAMAILAAKAQDQLRDLWFALAIAVSLLSAMLWHDMLQR